MSKSNNPSASGWNEMMMFQRDALQNHLYAYRRFVNPFAPRRFSFRMAKRVSEEIAMGFGRWQESECRRIKADLIKMDRHGLGRVALGTFYQQPNTFSENVTYLRSIGALDDTFYQQPNTFS